MSLKRGAKRSLRMIVTLRTERIRTLDQIRAFLDGSEPTDFRFAGRDSAYDFVRRTLVRFEFHGLKRDEKGLSDHRKKPPAKPFPRRYTPYDAALLAEVDEAFTDLKLPVERLLRQLPRDARNHDPQSRGMGAYSAESFARLR